MVSIATKFLRIFTLNSRFSFDCYFSNLFSLYNKYKDIEMITVTIRLQNTLTISIQYLLNITDSLIIILFN
jgi:hypothetical protein